MLSNEVLTVGAQITEILPKLLQKTNLPVPATGGGFLWKYSASQTSSLEAFALFGHLDSGRRIRLFLDTITIRLVKSIATWAAGAPAVDFEVAAIVNHRTNNEQRIVEFLVDWHGTSEQSWEPESNLEGCRTLLAQFYTSLLR